MDCKPINNLPNKLFMSHAIARNHQYHVYLLILFKNLKENFHQKNNNLKDIIGYGYYANMS